VGIINIVCGFIIVYKIFLFKKNAAIITMQIKFGVFPYVIRKTKWNAPAKLFFNVCGRHVNMCNIFSTKERGWVFVENHQDPNYNPKPPT
jgi:hypothetical protein